MQRPLPKLDFNVTNRCNFRCRHCCFSSGERQMPEFSLGKISEVLTEFVTLGGERIDVTGGEPTIRRDVAEIIGIAKNLGLKVELVTNGSLLTTELMGKLAAIGLDQIAVSLDGSDYETYSRIRPVPECTYERIICNIKTAIARGFTVKLNTLVCRENIADIMAIVDLGIAWGAYEHGFYYFTPVGRGSSRGLAPADPLVWLNLIRHDLKTRREAIRLSIETPIMETAIYEQTETECYLYHPWHLQILPDGNVYPCAIMAFHGLACGNLYRKSLSAIWNDPKLWNGYYYCNNVSPLMEKYKSCVDLGTNFADLINEGSYRAVCLMCKYSWKELRNENDQKDRMDSVRRSG